VINETKAPLPDLDALPGISGQTGSLGVTSAARLATLIGVLDEAGDTAPSDIPDGTVDQPKPGPVAAEVVLIEDALTRINRRTRQRSAYQQLMAVAGLSIERAAFMVAKHCEDGPVRLSDLAAKLEVNISTISRHVRQLERDGLLRRGEDPRDRRAAMLYLTDQGRAALERAWAARRAVLVRLLDQWSPEDRERFAELFTRFANELDGAYEATIREQRRERLGHGGGRAGDRATPGRDGGT
jgi:DNA-binding MarR family transcriptional regulator